MDFTVVSWLRVYLANAEDRGSTLVPHATEKPTHPPTEIHKAT